MADKVSAKLIIIIAAASVLAGPAAASPGSKGKGNPPAHGYWKNGPGSAGAPLPLLGATLLGQLVAAGGIGYLWWRRRQRRQAEALQSPSAAETISG
ncbi:MAG: hypothetical protein ACFCUN_02090 [Hyphomicrobiaceae bacterium]